MIDTLINTQSTGYIYKIELWNNGPGNRFLIGEPAYASSVFLSIPRETEKQDFY